MSEKTVRAVVIFSLVGIWTIALIVASFDGNIMLRATTPVLTMAFGWLFAARIS